MRIPLGDTGKTADVGMYTKGQLAFHMGISSQTVSKWERCGVIPPAMYKTNGGHRLYTQAQLDVMVTVIHRHKKPYKTWRIRDEFIDDMHNSLSQLSYGLTAKEIKNVN